MTQESRTLEGEDLAGKLNAAFLKADAWRKRDLRNAAFEVLAEIGKVEEHHWSEARRLLDDPVAAACVDVHDEVSGAVGIFVPKLAHEFTGQDSAVYRETAWHLRLLAAAILSRRVPYWTE